jgi:hypothetical protein
LGDDAVSAKLIEKGFRVHGDTIAQGRNVVTLKMLA